MEQKPSNIQLPFQNQEELEQAYKLAFNQAMHVAEMFVLTGQKAKENQKQVRKIIDTSIIPTVIKNLLDCNKKFKKAAEQSGLIFKPELDDIRIRRLTRGQLELHLYEVPGQERLPF